MYKYRNINSFFTRQLAARWIYLNEIPDIDLRRWRAAVLQIETNGVE